MLEKGVRGGEGSPNSDAPPPSLSLTPHFLFTYWPPLQTPNTSTIKPYNYNLWLIEQEGFSSMPIREKRMAGKWQVSSGGRTNISIIRPSPLVQKRIGFESSQLPSTTTTTTTIFITPFPFRGFCSGSNLGLAGMASSPLSGDNLKAVTNKPQWNGWYLLPSSHKGQRRSFGHLEWNTYAGNRC